MFFALIAILSGISNVISRSINFVLSEKLGVTKAHYLIIYLVSLVQY